MKFDQTFFYITVENIFIFSKSLVKLDKLYCFYRLGLLRRKRMDVKNVINQLKNEIAKVIIGKDELVELFTISILVNGHILLESVPGTGKTTFAKTFARSINASFKRMQFTPDVLPSDVTGIQFYNMEKRAFELRPGPIVTNIFLADEINRATPRTQSSLLEVMEEMQVTIDGETIRLEPPFMVIATQNPVESQEGTFPLPIAQMDRFFMKLDMEYPVHEDEKRILALHRGESERKEVKPVLNKEKIEELGKRLRKVYVNDDVENYILEIVRKSREHPDIELGISPRGSIALMRAAQGRAFLEGREYVTPNDVKEMIQPVCLHRIYLTADGLLRKSPADVIEEILEEINAPVEVEK